jgi:predicted Zn-dependent protease
MKLWHACRYALMGLIGLMGLVQAQPLGSSLSPDDTQGAWDRLSLLRQGLMVQAIGPEALGQEMLRLGMWDELEALLTGQPAPRMRALRIEFALRQHRYAKAQTWVDAWLAEMPQNLTALGLSIPLEVRAWRLDQAKLTCHRLLEASADPSPWDAPAMRWLAQIALFEKDYRKALARAQQAIQWDSTYADAWYLMGEAYFWLRQPKAAEAALYQCLRHDPYHADARFAYGYAIWRRGNATQLSEMAAQWEIALAVDPLHFRTHWHWGNGHTHLTFADYADPDEAAIRSQLQQADDLIAAEKVDSALRYIQQVEARYPQSVIPTLHRASAWYMHYPRPLSQRLDSAQRIFREILARKPHYGPAHNGLAAVIKQRQFTALRMYDSLEQVIADTEIPDLASFAEVFPDIHYYPGERVPKMIWSQLYTSVVYFPFLARQRRPFVIPPLHLDLSIAMSNRYFRYGTTFDHRQWMDIRGVGSGATGIEYVERGAHLERNVTLHEYVHLFHGYVFTEAEARAVRARYYHAMANDLTLDYYSANNEWEYLAQTFPAYFIPVKVHPLNHKAVNTRSDLQQKDPLMFAFIDSLVRRQRAYLAGDSSAMADNWAQVYLNLAQQAQKRQDWEAVYAHLDTAYRWDSSYLPVQLGYAKALFLQDRPDSARRWLAQVAKVAPEYAPLYRSYALGIGRDFEVGRSAAETAVQEQARLLRKAIRLEDDLQLRADLYEQLWGLWLDFGHWQEAIEVAERYALDAPEISTHLRDRRDEALAVASLYRAHLGYEEEPLAFLADLVARKPQQFRHRKQYAQALLALGRPDQAQKVLQAGLQLLEAADQKDATMDRLLAKAYLAMGDTARAWQQWYRMQQRDIAPSLDLLDLQLDLGDTTEVRQHLSDGEQTLRAPADRANGAYLRARLAWQQGDSLLAATQIDMALAANPYHLPARRWWIERLAANDQRTAAQRYAQEGALLPLPPGPQVMQQLRPYLPEEEESKKR